MIYRVVEDWRKAPSPGVPAETRPRANHPISGRSDATVPLAKPR